MASIRVGIAELHLAQDPAVLVARGLGSCLAVMVYDSVRRCGGLAHVLLPEPHDDLAVDKPGTYVTTAVRELVDALEASGSQRGDLVAKLVGGSQMFEAFSERVEAVGVRNLTKALEILEQHQIPVVAQETGGSRGRSLEFDLASGKVIVNTVRAVQPTVL